MNLSSLPGSHKSFFKKWKIRRLCFSRFCEIIEHFQISKYCSKYLLLNSENEKFDSQTEFLVKSENWNIFNLTSCGQFCFTAQHVNSKIIWHTFFGPLEWPINFAWRSLVQIGLFLKRWCSITRKKPQLNSSTKKGVGAVDTSWLLCPSYNKPFNSRGLCRAYLAPLFRHDTAC